MVPNAFALGSPVPKAVILIHHSQRFRSRRMKQVTRTNPSSK